MLPFVVYLLVMLNPCQSQTYDQTMDIFKNKLGNHVYHPDVRPVLNQSEAISVGVDFELLTIVEVNDVSQTFLCNGIVGFHWFDERLEWNTSEYGGHQILHPKPKDIWRPRVILLNTLDERDIFEDDLAPVSVDPSGFIIWAPGSLFSTSCKLDLSNFPFDKQTCFLQFASMFYTTKELTYYTRSGKIQTSMYVTNGEWELLDTDIRLADLPLEDEYIREEQFLPTIQFTFYLKRRPTFYLLSIIMPVVFLSLLNLLVFWIPVESGEKIGYGITVLLALAVFLSITSGLLPSSSETIPLATMYMFILLIISALTVVFSIIINSLHHKEEKEDKRLKEESLNKSDVSKSRRSKHIVLKTDTQLNGWGRGRLPALRLDTTSSKVVVQPHFEEGNSETDTNDRPKVNRYKIIGKHINLIFFIVFFIAWVSVTIVFMTLLATA